ncbi:MAG TPA: oxygenase MpaB family protein [Vicinamibacterales bacterium]|nr:oxygenase MpaB family protein [Vicinamibacterales bacterium]
MERLVPAAICHPGRIRVAAEVRLPGSAAAVTHDKIDGADMTSGPDSLQHHRAAVRARLLRSDHVRAGPESITWKVNREVIVVAGWGRAILLQLAHPAVAAGVHGHSSFRGSLLASFRRLHSTVGAMLSLTFGDAEQMITAAARINTIHDRVRGRVPRRASPSSVSNDGAGEAYSAHDPDLQRWVHATLLESIPLTYELLVGPLTVRERDRYCAEAAIMEPLLGMPAGWLPRDSAQLDTYMREMLAGGSIVVTGTSRALARALLYPPQWHLVWPAFRALQLLTIGSLPPSIRRAYGFEWRARDVRAFARWTALLRMSVRLLPPLAREWPMARGRGLIRSPEVVPNRRDSIPLQ